jgi:hypothetical protein
MRSTTVALVIVVALALALCMFSYVSIRRAVTAMDDLRLDALSQVEQGELTAARESLVAIALEIERVRPMMEILASHDALHEVMRELADAQICLESGELIEFQRAATQLGHMFKYILDLEEPSLANLF